MKSMSRELDRISSEVRICTKCDLYKERKIAVPGEGPADARVMFIGEGPGAQEDLTGRPFVGSAGKLLTELLGSIGVDRSSVFITNIVKCRPPNNRPPRKTEIETCVSLYLQPQIRIINPRVIVPLGTPAIKTLMGDDYSATSVHGQAFRKDGRLFLPLFHPAAALYDVRLRNTMFKDVKMLRELLDGREVTAQSIS
ncbi:uracil-DNA glycosylase [Candidatus Bathyarchaeota archaeon]|nr:MAG: uracil-DNA glycosylase [Candidatus Bathyarchaeota archaeon]